MIGSLDPARKEAVVVGAGASGLVIAHTLDRMGFEVTLLEAAARAGGLIRTQRTEWGIAEGAAHSILVTPRVAAFCESIGARMLPVRDGSRARYVLREGKLRKFPLSIGEALAAFLRAYFVLAPARDPGSLDMERWGERFLGRPATEYLLAPFIRGIYGAEPGEISVGQAFPALSVPRGHSLLSFQLARRIRRRPFFGDSARPVMMAPEGGMGEWVSRLEESLASRLGSRFVRGQEVRELPRAANVVVTVPARAAARIFRENGEGETGEALSLVRYAPLVSVTAFLEKARLSRVPRGVGVLMPRAENRRCLGVLFNSSAFPGRVTDEERWVSVTMMLGGTSQPRIAGLPDGEIGDIVASELESLFGPGAAPAHLVIQRAPNAVPLYGPELAHAWKTAKDAWCSRPGRILFANYAGQLSLRALIEAAGGLAAGLQSFDANHEKGRQFPPAIPL